MRNRTCRLVALTLAAALALSSFCAPTARASSYATLEYGSRGAEVLQLQKALLALGYNPNGTDGKFGTGTQKAVVAYQKASGLTADGKAGSLTLTLLYSQTTVTDTTVPTDTTSGTTSTVTSTNPNTLKYGDKGDKVLALQTALVQLGYNTNGIDGQFGAGTKRAVINFQSAQGLTADGLAGTRTLNKLYALAGTSDAGASTPTVQPTAPVATATPATDTSNSDGSYSRTLRKGMTGADVTSVQTKLKALGYYTLSIDGVYGTGSIAAVKKFQQSNGLTADGLAGQRTFITLFSSSAIASGATTSPTDTPTATNPPTTDSSAYVSLSYGSKGEAVTKLQKALAALNYNVGADGDYGALTQSAVAAFQKQNGLTADGVAGAKTQQVLYGGSAKAADPNAEDDLKLTDDTGKASGPSVSSVKLLHWYNEVKPSVKAGQTITVFDPATSLQWTLRLYSLGHHADSEPLTLTDTKIMYKAFGYTNTWTPKAVYVKLPSGTWTLATMHNVPHLTGSIKDNGFNGHLCVHFLRDMAECAQNDPNYGVTHQNAIRKKWKEMTGITVE